MPGSGGFDWVPVALAIVMEAAWISVIAGLVQEFALRTEVLGIVGLVAFVAGGAVLARTLEPRLAGRWPAIGTILVFLAALVGVGLSPSARLALASAGPAAALADNPGGLLAGLAVLRGFAHGGERLAVDTVGRGLFLGIPVIAVAATIGGLVDDPWRSAFLVNAALAAVVFVAAGLLTLALAALADIRRTGTATSHANPVWMAMVVLTVVLLLAVAVPIGLAGGQSIAVTLQAVIAGAVPPLAIVGLVIGGRAAIRRLVLIVGGTVFVAWLLSFAPKDGLTGPGSGGSGAGSSSSDAIIGPVGVASISGISVVVAAVIVFLLIRAWMRRQEPLSEEMLDVRSSDLPAPDPSSPPLRRRRRLPWTPAPRTAVEAYLALVEDLRDEPDVRRRPAETPAQHARRIREEQVEREVGIGLGLLAADYGLAVYGRRPLSEAETRRAIGRWQLLRRQLRVHVAGAPERRTAADDAPPVLDKPSRPY